MRRSHPVAALAGVLGLVVAALLAPPPVTLVLLGLVLLAALVRSPRTLLTVALAALPLALFGGVLTGLVTDVPQGVRIAARLALLTAAGVLFGLTIPAYALVQAAERARLDPRLGYLLGGAVALLPRLRHRAAELRSARVARGWAAGGGSGHRLRGLVGVVGPLLLSVLAENEERALALHSRGFPGTTVAVDGDGLAATELTVRYDDTDRPALDRLSLDVPAGTSLTVRGGNGSGKSTLSRALAGVELPATITGKVSRPGQVGVIGPSPSLQRSGLAPDVATEIGMGLAWIGVDPSERPGRVVAVASALGLDHLLDRHPDRLSSGEQQRVALASVLVLRPAAVVLDDADRRLDADGRTRLDAAVAAAPDTAVLTLTSRLGPGPSLPTPAAPAPVGPPSLPRAGRPPHLSLTGVTVAGALHDLDLDLPPGTSLGVAGPNGAGKTTLARLLIGLQRPTAGTVCFDGIDTARTPVATLARTVGFLPADPVVLTRTLATEVAFGPRSLGLPDIDDRVTAALAAVGLQGEAATHPYELTAAGRTLLALAAVLAAGTPVVVLDEPTAVLDGPATARVAAVLAALRAQRRTLILISHDPALLAAHTDRVLPLRAGRTE